jgi:hypothetical protein
MKKKGGEGPAGRLNNRRGAKAVKKNDDDEQPLRQRVREFTEGKYITVIMASTTIFALFGDDFRQWFTGKEADDYFFGAVCVAFVLFVLEIFVNSCVVNDFKYSFFWWLDIIATLSLAPDVDWITYGFALMMNMTTNKQSVDVIPGEGYSSGDNSKIVKLVSSLRLIRLIRIIKLYKYAVKTNTEAEEAKLKEQQKLSANA